MAIFIDVMYPDNANRKNRLESLTSDCEHFINDTSEKKIKITNAIQKTNAIIKRAYEAIAVAPPRMRKISIVSDITLDIVSVVAGLLSIPLATSMVKWAFSTYLLKTGKITAAELVEIGASKLIKINIGKFWRIGGNIGGAIVLALVVEAIIDSIDGAVQRGQLRSAIHKLVPERVNIKKALCLNESIYTTCLATVEAYDALVELGLYDETTLNKLATNLVKKHESKLVSLTNAEIENMLRTRDLENHAWMNEDYENKVNRLLCSVPVQQFQSDAHDGLAAKLFAKDLLLSMDEFDPDQKQKLENVINRKKVLV